MCHAQRVIDPEWEKRTHNVPAWATTTTVTAATKKAQYWLHTQKYIAYGSKTNGNEWTMEKEISTEENVWRMRLPNESLELEVQRGKRNSVWRERASERAFHRDYCKRCRCRVCVNTVIRTGAVVWALHWYLSTMFDISCILSLAHTHTQAHSSAFSLGTVKAFGCWLHLVLGRQQSSVIRNTFAESEAQTNLLFS